VKFGLKNSKHHSIVWCTTYFGIVNCLGVAHQCDGQMDGQTGRCTELW